MGSDMGDLWEQVPKEKYNVLLWRLVALVHFFVWTTKGLLRFFVFNANLSNRIVFPVPVYVVFYIATVIAAVFLIFFPRKFCIYAVVLFAWGIIRLIQRRSMIGITEYVLACIFAWHLGFFKTFAKAKVGILLGILLGAMVWLVGLRFLMSGTFLMWGLEFALVVGLGLALVLSERNRKQRTRKLPGGKRPVAGLAALGLAPHEIDILRRILKKEKYKSIAADYKMSEPTINRHVRRFFAAIGVADQDDFCRQYFDADNAEIPAAESVSPAV